MPLFSVILPTWNREDKVATAIKSVLQQTCTDFELLIIDDGSSDNTKQQIERYKDKRLSYIAQAHQGVSVARNNGIEKSQGHYIAFLDSDDYWHKNKLEKQKLFFAEQPQYKLVQTQEIWLRSAIRVNAGKIHRKRQGNIFQQSLERCCITPSSVAIDSELLKKLGGFDTKLLSCEDYELWLRITSQHKVGLIDELCMVRNAGHSDQLSNLYPAMDRFRIYSLLKLMLSEKCSEAQQQQANEVMKAKASILKQGLEKRHTEKTQTIQLLESLKTKNYKETNLRSCEKHLLDESIWSTK